MPTYVNPNPHPVQVTLLTPRTSIAVFPRAWPKSRIPDGGKQVLELDTMLARPLVQIGMLIPQAEAPRLPVTQPVRVEVTPPTEKAVAKPKPTPTKVEAEAEAYEPTHEERNATLDPHPQPKVRDSTTLIAKRKKAAEATASGAAVATETAPTEKPKKRFRVVDD